MSQFWQFWILAFVVMPVLVVGTGALGAWLHMRDLRRRHGTHPAE